MVSSGYEAFRSPPPPLSPPAGWTGALVDFGRVVDKDGSILHENQYLELLFAIIKLEDVNALSQYLKMGKIKRFGPKDIPYWEDPFWTAAAYGSTNALRLLLEYRHAEVPLTRADGPAPSGREEGLLQTACRSAQLEIVKLLLSDPWQLTYGDIHETHIHARYISDSTPLLCAAGSFVDPRFQSKEDRIDTGRDWIRNHLARAEEVVQLLLDRGACARDFTTIQGKPCSTVLSLAISRASSALVSRLIKQGANKHVKITQNSFEMRFARHPRPDLVSEVTPIHIGSLYSNIAGIQVLLDLAPDGGADMIRQLDSLGRLPLHWASWGPIGELEDIEADHFVPHITATIELLLETKPDIVMVNTQDLEGNTALHYAVWRHACYHDRHIAIPRVLCEHGADASIRGWNWETPLHGLGFRVLGGEPVATSLIDLLLEHGASVDDTDRDGNTPLHFAAKNLSHSEAARHLVSKGANMRLVNHQGNTPLHEAAGGTVHSYRPGKKELTVEDRVQAQNVMMSGLVYLLSRDDVDALMNLPNVANNTPRQICEERRNMWRKHADDSKNRAAGRGRGRGLGTSGRV